MESFKNRIIENKFCWAMIILSLGLLIFLLYFFVLRHLTMPEMSVQDLGDNASIFLLFLAGILTGFHCISMCGGFVVSYTAKNAKGPYKGPFITGLLNGLFIACGPLQAMYLYAAGTGSFIKGATSLAVFGLGTLPIMIGFGSLATVISHSTTKKILKLSAIIVLILGLVMINRGLSLTGNSFTFDSIKEKITGIGTNTINPGSNSQVNIVNGIQEVNMDVDASCYSPSSFVLKKGVPVKWNVNVKQLTGCNSELVLNDYGIDENLKSGLNVIEFTPDKSGTIRFSCGMGMIRGSFIVTDTGTASQEQVKSATPKSGGSCSMGSGGGGCGCGM